MFATTFFAIFVVPISRNPIVKPFLVLENGQIRDQLINSRKIISDQSQLPSGVTIVQAKAGFL